MTGVSPGSDRRQTGAKSRSDRCRTSFRIDDDPDEDLEDEDDFEEDDEDEGAEDEDDDEETETWQVTGALKRPKRPTFA